MHNYFLKTLHIILQTHPFDICIKGGHFDQNHKKLYENCKNRFFGAKSWGQSNVQMVGGSPHSVFKLLILNLSENVWEYSRTYCKISCQKRKGNVHKWICSRSTQNYYLAALRPTLGHCSGSSLTQTMLITVFTYFNLKVPESVVIRSDP